MSIVPSQIRTRYPAFDRLTDEYIQEFIDDAAIYIDPCVWGDRYDRALKVYAAHLIAINYNYQMQLGSALKGLETGDTLDPKLPQSNASEWLALTPYGLEFQQLLKESIAIVGVMVA